MPARRPSPTATARRDSRATTGSSVRSSRRVDTRSRRSVCPIACSLEILGDRWTLLVIRDLLLGRSRFRDFAASPEGIPTNVLSDRLARLVEHGIAERAALDDAPQTLGYRLTKKGAALRPLVEMLRDWGLRWEPGTQVRLRPRS